MKQLLIIGLLCLSTFVAANDALESALTRVGQKAPYFKVRTIEGGEFDLDDLKGRVILLNFFATWCAPCLDELPHLELDIWQKFRNEDFIVIAVGREHTKRDLVKFTNVVEFTFPIVPDPLREIYSKFATKYIPRNVVIDQSGEIIYQSVGYTQDEFEKMVELIEKMLNVRDKGF